MPLDMLAIAKVLLTPLIIIIWAMEKVTIWQFASTLISRCTTLFLIRTFRLAMTLLKSYFTSWRTTPTQDLQCPKYLVPMVDYRCFVNSYQHRLILSHEDFFLLKTGLNVKMRSMR